MTRSDRERGLRAAAARSAAAATRDGAPRCLAWREEIAPLDPLAQFAASAADAFFWERPDAGFALAAEGAVRVVETAGPDRFERADRDARALLAAVDRAGAPAPAAAGPLLLGGFAFGHDGSPDAAWTGFPAARLVLPERLLVRQGDRAWVTVVAAVAPGAAVEALVQTLHGALERARSGAPVAPLAAAAARAPAYTARADRSPADYCARVDRALDAIGAGELEKVVVARSVRLDRHEALDPVALLGSLRSAHPSCASFAVARAGAVWLGATPERLLRIEGDRVETAALAGSAPRGRSPEEDARLGRALAESKKEQSEHAVVVRALRAALAPHCRSLVVPEAPRLRRLDGIQHLETPIEGRLAGRRGLLALAGDLHPTPAVGGAPRDAALGWIARAEDLDRGWYAGPVGFLDAEGGGELAVALRAALLRGETARLFAGAGIVEGSQPEAELRETRLKLGALLAPLLEL